MAKNIEGIKPEGTLTERSVHTTIDSLLAIFKDFLDADTFPRDAEIKQLMLKPGTKQLGFLCTSEEWEDTGNSALQELPISFKLKRIYKV